MKTFKEISEVQLDEKFDTKKAEQTLKDIVKLFAQVKFVDKDKNIIKRWNDMYYTTYTTWFSTSEVKDMGLPTELK